MFIVVCSTCSGFCCEPCGQSFQYQSQYNKHVASRAHVTFVDEVSGFVQPVPVEEVCFFVHLISALLLIIPRLPFMMQTQSDDVFQQLTAEDVDHSSDVVEEAVDPIDDEDDPDIVEWFSGLGGLSTGNYHPFPSKIFALLFFLVNSPHPMVSRLLL